MSPLERIRAALGKRWNELLAERPRREAWTRLPPETLDRAFREAQRQAHTGRMDVSFATLLIAHLDHAVGLVAEPPAEVEAAAGDVTDAFGRLHRPDHGFAERERLRQARERAAEEAYARAYDEAADAGADDAEAHRAAAAARAEVLSTESG